MACLDPKKELSVIQKSYPIWEIHDEQHAEQHAEQRERAGMPVESQQIDVLFVLRYRRFI